MRFLFLLLISFQAYSQIQDFNDQSKDALFDQFKIPSAVQKLDKVKSINYKKKIIPEYPLGQYTAYYESLEKLADDMICNEIAIPSILEVESIDDLYGPLERALVKNSSVIPCNPKSQETVSMEKLDMIFNKLKSNPGFNNDHPSGHCFSRTYLISKELDDMGVKSKQLHINGWILGAYQKNNYFAPESYDVHKVNIVKVESLNGPKEYVIDPMFLDHPIELEEYKKSISLDGYPNSYSIRDQDDHYEFYRFNSTRGEEKFFDKKDCSYNEYLLEKDLDLVQKRNQDYSERHKLLLENKYLSREEALNAARNGAKK